MLHYIHKLRNSNLEKIIGLFVFMSLGILVIVFLLIGTRHNIFGGRYLVHTVFDQGYGLKAGAPVNIAGVEVGNVESVHFNDQNKIDVTASIQKKYKSKIRQNSIATGMRSGLVGNVSLSISIGSLSEPVVEDGGYIRGVSLPETDGALGGLSPILARANEAINNIVYLTDKVNSPLTKVDRILQRLDEVSKEIKDGKGNIGALLNNDNLYSNLTKMASTTERLLISLEKSADHFLMASKEFPKMIAQAEASMIEINKSAEKLPFILSDGQVAVRNIKDSSGELNKLIIDSSEQIGSIKEILEDFKSASVELPNVMRATQENVDEFTRIIEGAEKNWVVKGFLERKKKNDPITISVRDSRYNVTSEEEK